MGWIGREVVVREGVKNDTQVWPKQGKDVAAVIGGRNK